MRRKAHRIKVVSLAPLFLAWLLCIPQAVHAAGDFCIRLMARVDQELSAIRPEFLAKHTVTYSHEVPVTAVKDQCSFDGCWVYGSMAHLESRVFQVTGKEVPLSEQYLLAQNLQERALAALEDIDSPVEQGGQFHLAEEIFRKHGLVPSAVWKPRIPFEKSPHANRFITFLNARISKFHIDSASTGADIEALKTQAKKDIQALFDVYIGPFPDEFDFNGVHYKSPQDFAGKLLPEEMHRKIVMVNVMDDGLPLELYKQEIKVEPPRDTIKPEVKPTAELTAKSTEGEPKPDTPMVVRFKNYRDVEKLIVSSIKDKITVPLSTEMVTEFIDRKTGIMSVGAFPVPEGFQPAPRAYRTQYNMPAGASHQMEIVGVDLDAQGRVIKYKVKNSYGTEFGLQGYLHMYPDYFNAYAKRIYLRERPPLLHRIVNFLDLRKSKAGKK